MKSSRRLAILTALVASVSSASAASAAVLVDETFAAGERTNLNLPAGAQWFSSSGASSLTYVADTSLTLATGTSGRHLLGYFTADGAAAALTHVGDSLSISFNFSVNGTPGESATSNSAMRIGLFDSTAGTRISADSTNTATTFDNYTGYVVTMSPSTSVASGIALRERTTLTGTSLFAGASYTAFAGSGTSQALTYGSTYTGLFTVTRTASGVDLSIGFTGAGLSAYSLTKSDDSPVTAFDTFVLYNVSNVSDGITLSDLVITHTSAVPEPSAAAALAGLGVLGLAAARRRRA